ncbi:hypothetical protein H5410_027004, partial [Solanum commersonii]
DKYVSRHDLPNPISTPTEDLLAKIIDKEEGSYTIFQVMKSDVSTLSTTVISHSSSIKLLEENIVTQSGKILKNKILIDNMDAQKVVVDNESPKERVETQTKYV